MWLDYVIPLFWSLTIYHYGSAPRLVYIISLIGGAPKMGSTYQTPTLIGGAPTKWGGTYNTNPTPVGEHKAKPPVGERKV